MIEKLKLFRALVDRSMNGIHVVEPATGRFLDVNESACRNLGYTRDEMLALTVFDVTVGVDRAFFVAHNVQVKKAGHDTLEVLHRRKDGTTYPVEVSLSFVTLDQEYLVAIISDITERKRVEETLQQTRFCMEHAGDGIFWLSPEGRLLYVNKSACRRLGYSESELLGMKIFDLDPDFQSGDWGAHWEKLKRLGTMTFETRHRTKAGEVYPVEVNANCVRVGGQELNFAFTRDITERKLSERQLKEAFSFNQKIISDASVGIIVFKASGPCVLANETAARTLNATVSQLLAQNFREIASWRASGMLRFAEEALATKEPRHCESNFVSSFGKEVSMVCHFSPFVQNGEPHLLLVFNDVTEKKKLEAQFLRAQRMESIGTLAGGIAHDLNNVLAPLLISIQLLREKITDADGQQILATLETNVNRGADLVKQVLTFGRGIQGERVMIQIKHIAREIKEIVRETFPKSVRLQMDVAPELWKISGDATQIEQVLLNLCVNARDAMPDGGKLSLRIENKVLDQIYAGSNLESKPGRHVVISVSDTGAGMTREVQDRIFEPFFTTKEHGKGTGLGLSTTLAIVKSHGGFIHCYSELGKGSMFKVYLPVGAAPDVETAAAEKPRLPRGRNELVLVVDDEEPIREIAKQILERFGYRVLLAANGAEAVKLYTARQKEIAVVITDMAMPVMDGPAAIAALNTINPNIKIIGSSGLDSGNKSGAAIGHFMPKPYTAETVLNMLQKVLQESPAK